MSITMQIAELRARMIARKEPRRAAELLVRAGMAIRAAVAYVLDLLAAARRVVAA